MHTLGYVLSVYFVIGYVIGAVHVHLMLRRNHPKLGLLLVVLGSSLWPALLPIWVFRELNKGQS